MTRLMGSISKQSMIGNYLLLTNANLTTVKGGKAYYEKSSVQAVHTPTAFLVGWPAVSPISMMQ